ncbi:MAG: hypothetical protein A2632_03225 [Candidatus Pacebacteria bacterium RIFCSPHIGHO2_01_FULL_46_16]|nr:MAG: hypothetical protein A2632_03225 [Candidatus Pacebacteria bacterium RIFCSPHIGHO2_01_FULL_46_16]
MSKIEWVALVGIVGTTLVSWLLLFGAAFLGYQVSFWLTVVICGGVLLLVARRKINSTRFTQPNYQQVIFVLAWGALFAGLLQTRMLEKKAAGWYSGGATWGDLALHTSFVSKFSTQPVLDLTSPIYAQQETRYPFLFDFYTAQLVRHGLSIQHALTYTSLSLLVASLVLFYRIVYRLTRSVRGVWIASSLFFCNGGLGVWYFVQDFLASKQSLLTFVQHQPYNYAHIADRGIHFSNVITDLLLPQRGIVLGLAIFLVVLFLWQTASRSWRVFCLSSLLIGLTPLIHVHTYLMLLGCLIWLVIIQRGKKIFSTRQSLLVLTPAVLLGVAQLWWMGIGQHGSQFVTLMQGWMEPKESLILFWLKNLGLELVFVVFGNLLLFWKTKQRTVLHQLLPPLVGVFFIGNLISLQPHVYDNIKLFFYLHLFTAFFTTVILLKLAHRSRILAATCFLVLTITGTLSVIRENQQSWQITSNDDLTFAAQVQAKTESAAIFLTADNHNHPIPLLAGRSTVLGYRGWLWTHGIPYQKTEAAVQKIYAGDPNALELLKKYHVSYVVIGNEEQQQFVVNNGFFYQNFPIVLQTASRTVFAVQ